MKKFSSDLSEYLKRSSIAASSQSPDKVGVGSEIVAGVEPVDASAIYLEKLYGIFNKHFMNENDIVFDLSRARFVATINGAPPNHSWTSVLAAGQEMNLLTYPVPSGFKLIINHYMFFGAIDNFPVIPWPQRPAVADGFEHAYRCSYIIKENGQPTPKIVANHGIVPTLFPVDANEGFTHMATQIAGDTNTDFGSIYMEFSPGTLFEVWFRNDSLIYNATVQRDLVAVGTRIRGYLRPIT